MSDKTSAVKGWTQVERPPNLHRRFEFGEYAETGSFLDRLAELSKEDDYYPDISFGRLYANVTVHARDGEKLDEKDFAFARSVNSMIDDNGSTDKT